MLELDVLLLPFYEQAFDQLTDEQKVTFERLLTSDDPDLYAWLMGHQPCEDAELADMVNRIITRVRV
jgi:antitoxin CptB